MQGLFMSIYGQAGFRITSPVQGNTSIAGVPVKIETNFDSILSSQTIVTGIAHDKLHPAIFDIFNDKSPFVFYGKPYTQFRIGGNGFITFDLNAASEQRNFQPAWQLPSDNMIRPAIFGPLKDWDYSDKTGAVKIHYSALTGQRKLVVSWCGITPKWIDKPQNSATGTFQIVLKENGTIENHLINIPASNYNGGRATQGIIGDGLVPPGMVVTGRNNNPWAPVNKESFRYTPSGVAYTIAPIAYTPEPVPEYIRWYQAGNPNPIGDASTLVVWPKKTTTYRAEIYSCWDELIESRQITIIVQEITVDAFNPLRGGEFGIIMPSGINVGPLTLQIFNRWGQRVFSTNDLQQKWNGKYDNDGRVCPDGVYPWVLLVDIDNKQVGLRGVVTLIRYPEIVPQ